MTAQAQTLEKITSLSGEGYKYGFISDIESEQAPPGLNEDTVRFISAKKEEPEWLLDTRSTIISKGISAGRGQNTYRGLVKAPKRVTWQLNVMVWAQL